MVFSETINKSGMVEEIDWLVDTDSTSYPLADKARRINSWLEHVGALIMTADSKWNWDDTNQTDLPIGTASLVANQQQYAIDTTHLKILRVECKDINGNYRELISIDESDITGRALSEFKKTAGEPRYYDKVGNSFFLYPKPSYSATKGFKPYFQRDVVKFSTDGSDTDTSPGFATPFHMILPLGASYDYALKESYSQKFLNNLLGQIQKYEAAIVEHYSHRDRDTKKSLKIRKENYGEMGGLGTNPDGF